MAGHARPALAGAAHGRVLLGGDADAGVRPVPGGPPAGVETVRRGDLLFVLDHGREPVRAEVLPGTYRDLLPHETITGVFTLGRYEAAVLRR